jgi:hypothetical protein
MMPRHDASFADFGGRHATDYAVRDDGDGSVHELGGATWADWDQRGRLAPAQDGRLLIWHRFRALETIEDFNGQAPDSRPSPPDAARWPEAPATWRALSDRNGESSQT